MAQTERKTAIWAVAALLVLTLLPALPPASAADYPRRIAVAPFVNLTGQDDIKPVVAVVPRLLATRLMALAGAETFVLPASGKSPEEAAKEARAALLLQGSVAKLGKGYSIDTTVVDLATGASAGAFFAGAPNEDEIIPQVGVLAADMAEKLFGVKTARPQPAPAPAPVAVAPAAAAPSAAPVPAAAVHAPGVAAATPAAASAAPPAPQGAVSAATGPADTWTPTSIKKVSQSDKIADELYGVVAGDTNAAGDGEVVAWGARTVYIYRVKGDELLPYIRLARPLTDHILNVEAVDLDGDGRKEILVTDLVGDRLQSYVLKRQGDAYLEAAEGIPYYLVVIPDWQGKPAVVGQARGVDLPFQGKFVLLRWDGKRFKAGDALPCDTNVKPLVNGVLGLSSARLGKEWRLLYTDEMSRLRVVGDSGKSEYRSRSAYGMGADLFEWGTLNPIEGKRNQRFLQKALRLAEPAGGTPLFVINEVKKGLLDLTAGSYDTSRVVLLKWDAGEFQEKAASPFSDYLISGVDVLSSSGLRRGGRVVAAVVEQFGSAWKDKTSRLSLFQAE